MIKINRENFDTNLIRVEINPTPIKVNQNMMNYRKNIINIPDINQDGLVESIVEKKTKNLRGRKKKRVLNETESYEINRSLTPSCYASKNFISSNIIVQKENFYYCPHSTLHITYQNTQIKINAVYNTNSYNKFKEIFIEKYSTLHEKEKIQKFLNENSETNYISSFTVKYILSFPEVMFNIHSNLQLENNIAILSNKLKSDEFLILVDSKYFFHSLNENYEYSIFSIKQSIFQEFLTIKKSEEIAILHINVNNQINSSSNNFRYYHYDIFSLENSLSEFLNPELTKNYINDLNKENNKIYNELNVIKCKENNLKKEFHLIEKNYNNKLSEMHNHFDRIQSEYKMQIDSLMKEIQNLNGTLAETNNQILLKEISILKSKLDSMIDSKKNISIHHSDEIFIESQDKKINDSALISSRDFLCIKCSTNFRVCILDKCSHYVYCEECLIEIFSRKKNKKQKKAKNFIECPICKILNDTFTKINFK